MEKIKVISEEDSNGKKFDKFKLEDSRFVTVWPGNDGNTNLSNMIRQNFNVECDAEVKQSGDYFNIRAFMPSNVTPQAEKVEVNPSEKRQTYSSDKDRSIVAQCLTKIEFRNHADPKPLDILESYRFFLKEL